MADSSERMLPVGKLPAELLNRLIARAPVDDPGVRLGPGVGLDCAVVDVGADLLVLKSDPITFVSAQMGRYLVEVNCNDIATSGARPRWLMLTLLLPEGRASAASVEGLFTEVYDACREKGISVVGGHTEVTHGLERVIGVATMLGTVAPQRLVTPQGARPGHQLLLTKHVPIEGISILASEFAEALRTVLSAGDLKRAQAFLESPGIGVMRDAQIALSAGRVSAMHDPTEGGLLSALGEMSQAMGKSLHVDLTRVPIEGVARRICSYLGIDPLATIASGALLLTAEPADTESIVNALRADDIDCTIIGYVGDEPSGVYQETANGREAVVWPARDEIARVYERTSVSNVPAADRAR